MEFREALLKQIRLHPSMRPQDAVKLCAQASRGAEHLLADLNAARRYFDAEFASVAPDEGQPLTEDISAEVCRANLAAWKARGLDPARLFALFVQSARIVPDGEARLRENLHAVQEMLDEMPFSAEEWRTYLAEYVRIGMPAVHHSAEYRAAEQPAYRIVRRDLLADLTR